MRSSFSVAINPYENVASIHEMLPEILESNKRNAIRILGISLKPDMQPEYLIRSG